MLSPLCTRGREPPRRIGGRLEVGVVGRAAAAAFASAAAAAAAQAAAIAAQDAAAASADARFLWVSGKLRVALDMGADERSL